MPKLEREIRGIPYFLLVEYLEEMGGKVIGEGLVWGPGWEVHLTRIEPFRIGSLEVGQTRIDIDIEDELVDDFLEVFGKKTLRAGG